MYTCTCLKCAHVPSIFAILFYQFPEVPLSYDILAPMSGDTAHATKPTVHHWECHVLMMVTTRLNTSVVNMHIKL